MSLCARILIAAALLCAATVRAAVPAQPMIGTPEVVLPNGGAAGAVVLFSGAAGWGDAERGIAGTLAGRGQIVIGVDLAATQRRMAANPDACVTLIGEIEAVSHQVQREAHTPAYHFPVLAGMQAGGTMALQVAGQASTATIADVLAVDPDPALPGHKPLCSEAPRAAGHDAGSYDLPAGRLPYGVDIRLSAAATSGTRLRATGFAGRHAEVRLANDADAAPALALMNGLAARMPAAGAAGVADLPLVELPVARPTDTFAVLYSGDGGWRDLDKAVAAILQRSGLPVVGVDVLRYFWAHRTAEQGAHDLGRIIDTYRQKWGASKVVLIGYSFGADVLPALYNRLPAADRAAVVQMSLLGFAATADFEVTVAGWLQQHRGDAQPTLPEVRRIDPQRVQCFYGADDDEAACAQIGNGAELIRTTGSHHFDGDYEALARRILHGLQRRNAP
ncbi:MAG: virulence factor family protein [Betaproteobacteria bacterium]|nr:MAG: virulence factor family protein [Betaproteobacteria bacterium]